MLDFPDIDRENELKYAKDDVARMIVERIVDEDVPIEEAYIAPEPFFDLQLCLKTAVEVYQMCTLNNTPEERKQLLRDFIAATLVELNKAEGAINDNAGPDDSSSNGDAGVPAGEPPEPGDLADPGIPPDFGGGEGEAGPPPGEQGPPSPAV
jgi:hypothetical protein